MKTSYEETPRFFVGILAFFLPPPSPRVVLFQKIRKAAWYAWLSKEGERKGENRTRFFTLLKKANPVLPMSVSTRTELRIAPSKYFCFLLNQCSSAT